MLSQEDHDTEFEEQVFGLYVSSKYVVKDMWKIINDEELKTKTATLSNVKPCQRNVETSKARSFNTLGFAKVWQRCLKWWLTEAKGPSLQVSKTKFP